jgi:hypothetical protein
MEMFPRTTVGGVSVSRMIIGSNWFLGYSHTSKAKDRFITSYQSRKSITDILKVFLSYGVDTTMSGPAPLFMDAIKDAEQATGKPIIRVLRGFNIWEERQPAPVLWRIRTLATCSTRAARWAPPSACPTSA